MHESSIINPKFSIWTHREGILSKMTTIHRSFTKPLLAWFDKHGRKNLPWQFPQIPYRVWISEIMLQQTQVKTVIPYFNRFIDRFPDINVLALASEDEVLAHWSGLGYYSRARNIHKTAKIIHTDLDGEFPSDLHQLVALPGIGPSTAAAIASLAFDKPTAILDGNVKRVLSRYFLIDGPLTAAAVNQQLWQRANECMPLSQCAKYTQAIMDMGATCCTAKNPDCERCPLKTTCRAKQQHVVAHYPQKKIKVSLPIKQQQLLLLHTDNNLIYLEKRPPTGIWGGLWCLPSVAVDVCPVSYIQTRYTLRVTNKQDIMTIKHSFSHFHLHITALSLHSELSTHSLAEYPGNWFHIDDMNKLGLAKPVRTIIDRFHTRNT